MLFYLGIIFLAISGSNGQDSCRSPSGAAGDCVNISECGQLLELLKQPRPLPSSTLDILTKSQCGFVGNTPKVCCARNTQPGPTTTDTSDITTASVGAGDPQPPDVTRHPNLRFLDLDQCGPIEETRIVGGNKTKVFEFPWMALIGYDVGKRDPEFRCGGSLISKRYILTAAHCVSGLSSSIRLVGVRVGEHDLSKERDCDMEEGIETNCADKYQDYLVEKVYAHPGYNREKLQNDIALIRINGDADFRPKNVKPICLPIGSTVTKPLSKIIVTGWGATESGYRSQDLLKVKLPVVPNAECAKFYKNHAIDIAYKQLCAGGSNQMDSCSGDSGGPMQLATKYFNGVPKYVQFGVVSFGPRNCGIEGFPGVYTRVAYYMDWILNTMTD